MATDVWAVVTTLGTVLAGIVALIALIVSMVLRDGTRQAKLDAAEARRLAERSAAAAEASAEAARRGAQESQRSNELLEADLIRRAQARDAARYRWSVACIPTNRTGISRFHLLNTAGRDLLLHPGPWTTVLTMKRGIAALLLTGSLALAGCSGADSPFPDPTGSSSAASTSADPEPEEAAQFGINDTAEFDDGLSVGIAGATAEKSTTGTDDLVTASVLVENKTQEPYDPVSAIITASYGDQTPTTVTTAEDGAFEGPIAAGDEGVTAVTFTVPRAQLKNVTIVVDLGDDDHDPVQFTGEVQQGEELPG